MKKISVMYISNEGELGGAAQSLLNMIKGWNNSNINAVVIIPREGIIEERLKELDITYYIVPYEVSYGRIGMSNTAMEDKNFLNNYSAALRLKHIIEKENIQLIHSNSSVCNLGAISALMSGIPHIWHFREYLEEDFDCEFWDKPFKKKLIESSDKIITISNSVKKAYRLKYGIESVQIYNGLEMNRYIAPIPHNNIKNRRFILASRITYEKGQWEAIKAVKILVESGYTDIELNIVGSGSDRLIWSMKKYIKDNGLEKNIYLSF